MSNVSKLKKLKGLNQQIVDDMGNPYQVSSGSDLATMTVGQVLYSVCVYGRGSQQGIGRVESKKRRELGKFFADGEDEVTLSKDELERLVKLIDGNETRQPALVMDFLDDVITAVETVEVTETKTVNEPAKLAPLPETLPPDALPSGEIYTPEIPQV